MKFNIINKFSFAVLLAVFAFGWTGCNLEEIPDPNGADVGSITNDASVGQLQNVVTGTESLLRKEVGFYYDVTSIIGRDYYFFTGSDPRYTGEILGKGDATLDNAGFYGNRPYSARYRTVKNGNILIDGATNSTSLTDAQRSGYLGFAKTIQAYELLLVANMQYNNGIRLDVSDTENLGAFTSSNEESLAGIAALLEEAAGDLADAEFNFILSIGFAGFDNAADFLKFNRAIAARVALYRGQSTEAVRLLGDSFYDVAGILGVGPARPYSIAGGELQNNVFRPTNQSDAIIAHPDVVALLTGTSKISDRGAEISLDGLTGTHDVTVFNNRDAFIPLITNEELALIAAEGNIGTDNVAAEEALNAVRAAYNLDAVSGLSDADLLDAVVAQRRISLFGEGHRWVDMRRLGRLDQIAIDRDGDNVWESLPRPVTEN